MEDLVSIVVPIYNVERYLDRCIASIINQTYSNLEIILVDDGSPDKCPELCDFWATKDNRIKVIHKKNGGLSDARNFGIESASGKYIGFIDSDDFVETDMVECMLDAIYRTGSEIATCGRHIYSNGKVIATQKVPSEAVYSSSQGIKLMFKGDIIEEAAWDKLYLKSLFNGIRFPVGHINEDIPIMPYIFIRAKSVVCVDRALYYYCDNPNSITHSKYDRKKTVVIEHIKELEANFIKLYPEYQKEFSLFKCRYAYNMMFPFEFNPKLKEDYEEDYKFYSNTLHDCLIRALLSKEIKFKRKIQMVLMDMGIYRLLWAMTHKKGGEK